MRTSQSSEAAGLHITEIDRNGLEILDADECRRLLAQTTFSRIGVSQDALPLILPINYRFVEGRIAFQTASGAKLTAAASGSVVVFEVDDMDPLAHTGWSVVVTGVASLVTDPAEVARLEDAGVPRWTSGNGDRFVELPLQMVSGRRMNPCLASRRRLTG